MAELSEDAAHINPLDAALGTITTLEDYGRAREAVVTTLLEIADAADTLSLPGAAGRLKESSERLRGGLFTLLVIGDFKTGKSSFLNALMDRHILPTAVTPCTALLAIIQYAADPYVRVERFNGESELITIEEFATGYCLSTREEENERFKDIEQLEIGAPVDLLQDRVRIVDSPGLDESPQRTAITSSHIPRSDAAVFMMGADRLGREHEMTFLHNHILDQGVERVFFVINRCDVIEDSLDPDREWRALRARAWQLLMPAEAGAYKDQDLSAHHIFFLSARRAREAQLSGNADQLSQSGLPALQSSLERFLARDRGQVALQRPANLGRETIEAIRRAAQYRTHLLTVSLDELEDRIAQTQPDFDRISRARDQAEQVIFSQRDRCRADLGVRLRTKVAQIQDSMRRVVSKFDFPGADSFTGRLTASVRMEPVQRAVAEQLDRYLSEEFAVWIHEVEAVVEHYLAGMTEQLGDNARQVHRSLAEIQLKIIGPQVMERAAAEIRDPVARMMALQESVREGDFSTVLKETEALWKGTARTLAAEFAGVMLLGWLGLATNPIAFAATMASVSIGMAVWNTNIAIEGLRNGVADIARKQMDEVPARALPELDRQVDQVFQRFTDAYLKAIDTLVGQEWETLKSIRDEKERQAREAAPQMTHLAEVLSQMDACEQRLAHMLAEFQK